MGIFAVLFIAGSLVIFYRVVHPRKDFAEVRDQVSVISSGRQFSSGEKGRFVTTVGVVSNATAYGWKEAQMEVRYFDQQGRLIDVGVQRLSDVTIQPHSESAFRIRSLADQEENAYASQKVFVRSARDIRRWP